MRLQFEALNDRHDRSKFSCGVAALDGWFSTRASQDQRRRVAQVFVGTLDGAIVGFYSLSMFTIALDALPPALAKKLPRYEAIPAALIGRLARDQSTAGKGVGSLLLADAVTRVLAVARSVAAYAIVVDAKDDAGQEFYLAHGFISLPSRARRLFLLAETAAAAARAAAGGVRGG